MAKKAEIKCPWCEKTIPTANVKVKNIKNDYGTLVERRCPECDKILASYLEEEGDFLAKMRTF